MKVIIKIVKFLILFKLRLQIFFMKINLKVIKSKNFILKLKKEYLLYKIYKKTDL